MHERNADATGVARASSPLSSIALATEDAGSGTVPVPVAETGGEKMMAHDPRSRQKLAARRRLNPQPGRPRYETLRFAFLIVFRGGRS